MPDTAPQSLPDARSQPMTRRTFLKCCTATAGSLAGGALCLTPLSSRPAPGATDARPQASRGESSHITLHVMPHSHIDVEWYWTLATTREWTADILNKAMALLRRDPDFRFTQDQVVLLRSYWESLSAEDQASFKQMVHEGRLAIVGGMLVQPEVAEPSGESLVRQILLGQQWLQATLGIRARCGWFIDTFGQIPQLPQILRRAGYESYVFWRDVPLAYPVESLPADFYCESPDGTRILTHWLAGGYSFGDEHIRTAIEHSRTCQVLVPYGSDVSRPTEDCSGIRRIVEQRLRKLGIAGPQLRVSTALEYFNALRAEPGQLPVVRMDFNPPERAQDLRGTYDNRIELKKRNRLAEQALYSAECLAAIAFSKGRPYPQAALRELWEKLLFSQFHDIMGGSHSDPVYLAAMDRLQSVLTGTGQIADTALRQIDPGMVEAGEWSMVYNTLSFSRTELCRMSVPGAWLSAKGAMHLQDSDGRNLPCRVVESPETWLEFIAHDVPATGYRAYRLASGGPRAVVGPRKLGPTSLENERFYLEWDRRTGDLIRLRDKRRSHEVLAAPSNVLIFAQEKNPNLEGDLHLTGQEVCSSAFPASSIVPGQDDLGLHVTFVTRFPDCLLERQIVLWDRTDRIDFRATLHDFTGGDVLVKASFAPNLDWVKAERVYETPFASTPRPDGHFAAQTWVDCSDGRFGVALLNRGTPGYWIAGGKLELVLLRSLANYVAYQKSALKQGVPGYEHSPQTELAREHGTHQFDYALSPHSGSWRSGQLPALGASYNTPLVSLAGVGAPASKHAGQTFIGCSPDFLLTAMKQSEDGAGLALRGYETRGQAHSVTVRVPRAVRSVQRANLLEETEGTLPLRRGRVSFSCRPHEIVTLLLRW